MNPMHRHSWLALVSYGTFSMAILNWPATLAPAAPRGLQPAADESAKPDSAPPASEQAPARTLTLRLEKGDKLLVDGVPVQGDPTAIFLRIRDEADLQVVVEVGDGVAKDDIERLQQIVEAARKQRDLRERELWEQIAQRKDPQLRKEALERLRSMLASAENRAYEQAVRTLRKVRDVPFDRKPFLPLVRRLIADQSQTVYTRAIAAVELGNLGGGKEDIPMVAAMADDPNPFARKAVAAALYGLDPEGEHPLIATTIEKLLADRSSAAGGVVHHTIKSLWGNPVSAAAERRLIELSQQPGQVGYDAVYYALSTRPLISKAVAERLAELALTENEQTGRAVWGLSHHRAGDDSQDLAVATLITIYDDTLDGNLRQDCVYGFGLHGGHEAIRKLHDIAVHEENAGLRRAAAEALQRARRDS